MQKTGKLRLRIGQFLSVVGGLFLFTALALGIRNAVLLRSDVKTTGKITQVTLDVKGANFPHTETFQFATPDGRLHTITSRVNELPQVVDGQSITVLYKHSNPSDAFNANDLAREALKDAIGGTIYLIIGIFLWRGAIQTIKTSSQHLAQGRTQTYDAH